jgi:hypothetical protein
MISMVFRYDEEERGIAFLCEITNIYLLLVQLLQLFYKLEVTINFD